MVVDQSGALRSDLFQILGWLVGGDGGTDVRWVSR